MISFCFNTLNLGVIPVWAFILHKMCKMYSNHPGSSELLFHYQIIK